MRGRLPSNAQRQSCPLRHRFRPVRRFGKRSARSRRRSPVPQPTSSTRRGASVERERRVGRAEDNVVVHTTAPPVVHRCRPDRETPAMSRSLGMCSVRGAFYGGERRSSTSRWSGGEVVQDRSQCHRLADHAHVTGVDVDDRAVADVVGKAQLFVCRHDEVLQRSNPGARRRCAQW